MNDDDVPHFLPMIALVAVIVALVILIFFGIGYAFGRLFLKRTAPGRGVQSAYRLYRARVRTATLAPTCSRSGSSGSTATA